VSSRASTDVVKVGSSGLKNMLFLPDRNKLFISFTNGSVGVLCLLKRKMEY
jgi:hypothetical protein